MVTLLLALAGATAMLASPVNGAKPIAYQVEMLIFTHEYAAPMADGEPAQPLMSIQDAEGLSGDSEGKYFHALPASELTLTSAKSVVQNSPNYKLIEHIAWVQPGLDQNAAKAVHIHGGAEYRRSSAAPTQDFNSPNLYTGTADPMTLEELDGTVKVVLGHYLHVYTDLVLRKPVSTQTYDENQQPQRINALYQFRMQDHRRMRSKELHYIDHPLLGILVQITPVEQESRDQEPGAGERVQGLKTRD